MSDTTATDTTAGVSLGTTTGDSGSGDNSKGSQESTAATTTTGSSGSGGEATAWYSAVEDTDLKGLAEAKGWKSPADALKSYKELETMASAKGVGAKPPASADDYKFTVPTDLPKEAGYNEAFAGWFKEAAHKTGLTQESAAAIHDQFVQYAKSQFEGGAAAQTEAYTKSVETAQRDLETAWGQKGTPTFDRNIEMAKRAIRMADPKLMDALKEVGAIGDMGGQPVVRNAVIVQALAKMGAGMFAEDRLYGTPASDKNPFDDATTDMAMQGRLIKEDPAKAATLIRAAGKQKMFEQFLRGSGA